MVRAVRCAARPSGQLGTLLVASALTAAGQEGVASALAEEQVASLCNEVEKPVESLTVSLETDPKSASSQITSLTSASGPQGQDVPVLEIKIQKKPGHCDVHSHGSHAPCDCKITDRIYAYDWLHILVETMFHIILHAVLAGVFKKSKKTIKKRRSGGQRKCVSRESESVSSESS